MDTSVQISGSIGNTALSVAIQAAQARKEAEEAGQDPMIAEIKFYEALLQRESTEDAETRVRRAVNARESIGSWTVAVAIPKGATEKKFHDHSTGVPVHYAQFGQSVAGKIVDGVRQKGGWVNFFFHHGEPMQFVGKTVVCVATLVQKVMEDRSTYLYVDLVPAPEGTTPDRRLTVMHKAEEVEMRDDFIAFPTPSYGGVIIVSLLGSKVTTTDKKLVLDGGAALAKEMPELAWYMRRKWAPKAYDKKEVLVVKGGLVKVLQRPQPSAR